MGCVSALTMAKSSIAARKIVVLPAKNASGKRFWRTLFPLHYSGDSVLDKNLNRQSQAVASFSRFDSPQRRESRCKDPADRLEYSSPELSR